MTGILGHDSAILGYTGPGTTWANDMNIVMNHDPGIGFKSSVSHVEKNTYANVADVTSLHVH